jgi:hypothetical protein
MKKSIKAQPTSVVIACSLLDLEARNKLAHALSTEIIGTQVPNVRRQGAAIVCRFTSKAAAKAGYAHIAEHLKTLGIDPAENLRFA